VKTGPHKSVRCAIYTRVSTDHGLEQDFNSLDAQHEAAQAYIRSQAHAGWTLIRSRYEDGGRVCTSRLRGAHTIPSVSRLRLALSSRIPVLGGRPPYRRIAETRPACVACGKCRRNSSPHENCCCWISAKPRNQRKNLRHPKDKNNHNVRYLIPGGGRRPIRTCLLPPAKPVKNR
jgi:hypothetical protein